MTREKILDILPSLPPVVQAQVDMRLHEIAIRDDRFSKPDENFLREDMGLKRNFIRAMTKGVGPGELEGLRKGLQRDIDIHKQYLGMPENPNTGSHRWHQSWMGVYDNWLNILGRRQKYPGMPTPPNERLASLPPPPPPDGAPEFSDPEMAASYTLGLDQIGYAQSLGILDATQADAMYNDMYQQAAAVASYDGSGQVAAPPTDSYGNYWDGTQWISPEGNTFDPAEGMWRSADGQYVYINDQWVNPNAQAPASAPIYDDAMAAIAAGEAQAYGGTPDPITEYDTAVERLRMEAEAKMQATAEAEAADFIKQALSDQGYQQTENGWLAPEGATEEQFLQARDEAYAAFVTQRLDPIATEYNAMGEKLTLDTQALIDARRRDQLQREAATTQSGLEQILVATDPFSTGGLAADIDRQAPQGSLRWQGLETGAIKEYDVFKSVQQLAGHIGYEIAEHTVKPALHAYADFYDAVNPFASEEGIAALHKAADASPKVGEAVAELVTPGSYFEFTLEFLPGIGMVPGTAAFSKVAAKDGIWAAVASVVGTTAHASKNPQVVDAALRILAERVDEAASPTAARLGEGFAKADAVAKVTSDEVTRALDVLHIVNTGTPSTRALQDISLMTELRRAGVIDDETYKEALRIFSDQQTTSLADEMYARYGVPVSPEEAHALAAVDPAPYKAVLNATEDFGRLDTDLEKVMDKEALYRLEDEAMAQAERRAESLREGSGLDDPKFSRSAQDILAEIDETKARLNQIREELAKPRERLDAEDLYPGTSGDPGTRHFMDDEVATETLRIAEEQALAKIKKLESDLDVVDPYGLATAVDAPLPSKFKLPENLAKVADGTVFKLGEHTFKIEWESAVDRATFLSGAFKLDNKADWQKFATLHTGLNNNDLSKAGMQIFDRVKEMAKELTAAGKFDEPIRIPAIMDTSRKGASAAVAARRALVLERVAAVNDAVRVAREAMEQAPTVPVRELLSDALKAILPDSLRSVLNLNTADLTIPQWTELARLASGVSDLATRELELAKLVAAMQERLTLTNGLNHVLDLARAAEDTLDSVGIRRAAGVRFRSIDDMVAAAKKLSVKYKIRESYEAVVSVLSKSHFRKSQAGLAAASEYMRMVDSHARLVQLEYNDFHLALAAVRKEAGLEIKPGGLISFKGSDRSYTMAQLINNPPDDLPEAMQSFVGKYVERLTELNNMAKDMGITPGEIERHFLVQAGTDPTSKQLQVGFGKQLVPEIDTASNTRKAFPWEKGQRVSAENDPVQFLANNIEARLKWIQQKWAKDVSEELQVGKQLVDEQMRSLRKQLDEVKKRLEGQPEWWRDDEVVKLEAEMRKLSIGNASWQPHVALQRIAEVNNAIRSLNATLDLSFMGIQGVIGLAHDPVSWGRAFLAAINSPFGWSEAERYTWMAENMDRLRLAIEHGMEFYGDKNSAEFFYSNLTRPLTKPFDRAFSEFGNRYRLKAFDIAMNARAASGRAPDLKEVDELVAVINKMTGAGAGSGNKTQDFFEQLVFFAPRFFRSQFGMLADSLTKGGSLQGSTPFLHLLPGHTFKAQTAGDLARQSMLELVAVGAGITVAANALLGDQGDFEFLFPFKDKYGNPTVNPLDAESLNSNFMRIRWNGQDYSVFAQWDTFARLAMTAAVNPVDAAKKTIQFKGSPIAKPVIDALLEGGLFNDSTYGNAFKSITSASPGDYLGFAKGLAESAVKGVAPFALRTIIEDGMLGGPFTSASALALGLEMAGIKSSPLTEREKLDNHLNDLVRAEKAAIKAAGTVKGSDDDLTALAIARAKENPEYRAKEREYWQYVVDHAENPEDARWAQRLLDRDNERIANEKHQADVINKSLEDRWAEVQPEVEARKTRISELEAQLAEMFDPEEIRKIEAYLDKLGAQMDANSDMIDAARGLVAGGNSRVATLEKEKNAAIRAGILNGAETKAEAIAEYYDDLIVKAKEDDSLNTNLSGLYANAKSLSAAMKAASEERKAIYAELDPKIQATLDELAVLRAQQKAWSDEVWGWYNKTLDNNDLLRARLEGIDTANADVIAYYASLEPNSLEAQFHQFRNSVFEKYREEYTNDIPDEAWTSINFELNAYRAGLSAAQRELWDVINTPATKTELEKQFDSARNATAASEGTFYGVDVRRTKLESSLYGAALTAVGGAVHPNTYAEGTDPAQIESAALQGAQNAQQLIDQATQAVYSENPDRAVEILASISQYSGGDAGNLIKEFETMVRADARRNGRDFNSYNEALNAVTEAAVNRLGAAPEPWAIGEINYQIYEQAKAQGEATNGTSPDWAPVLSTSYPTGAAAQPKDMPTGVADYWKRKVQSEFFGLRFDSRTGTVTDPGFTDLAPQRDATYQFMFDHSLDSKEKIVAKANELLGANADSPLIRSLIMADPYVNRVFVTSPGEQYTPSARDYVIALDRVLRAIDGEEVVPQDQLLAGYRNVLEEKYFIRGATGNTAAMGLNDRIDALYNDPRVESIDKQIRLIGLDISDTYKDITLGILTREQAMAKIEQYEAQRTQLLIEKQRIGNENRSQINSLYEERRSLLRQPLPPGDALYQYLADEGATTGYDIQAAIQGLYDPTNPAVQQTIAFINGRAEPPPELQQWITERMAQYGSASNAPQLVQDDLRKFFVLDNPITGMPGQEVNTGSADATTRTWIIAGSILYALTGGAAASVPSGLRQTAAAAAPTAVSSGGYSSPSYSSSGGGGSSFTPYSGPSTYTPRTSMPSAPSSGGGYSQPRQSAPQQPAAPKRVAFQVTDWEDFKRVARTIFGSSKVADELQRAFVSGRPVSNPTMVRQLRFLSQLIPIDGAKSYEGWLSGMRLLFGGVSVGSRPSTAKTISEIRTRRAL